MCENQSEENKAKYMKNLATKVVVNSLRKEAEKELTELNEKRNNIFTLVKFIKKEEKYIEEGRYMRGKDGKLGLSEKKTEKHMEKSHGGNHE